MRLRYNPHLLGLGAPGLAQVAIRKKILCVFLPSPGVGTVAKLLKEAGFSVATAQNFRSALQGLYSDSPDAVLLDKKFTILDGLPSADIIQGILPQAIVKIVNLNDANFPQLVELLKDKLRPQANAAGTTRG